MRRIALALLWAGCVAGAPPDWSPGREWSFPILDPYDDTAVATLGYIDGHGPYVWFFDTGSTFTTLDSRLMHELGLHAVAAGYVDEAGGHSDRIGQVSPGQIQKWRIGDLQVKDPTFYVTRPMGDTYAGYRIAGTFGLASIRYLTLEIDRDAGRVRLALPGVIPTPGGVVPGEVYSSEGAVYVKTQIGGQDATLVLDTGAALSSLYEESVSRVKVGLDPGFHAELRTLKTVMNTQGAFVGQVKVGGTERRGVRFISQPGERWNDAIGLLGQNFLSAYHVILDLHEGKLWLAGRHHGSSIGRFGAEVRCDSVTLSQCFEGGAIVAAEDSSDDAPKYRYHLASKGRPTVPVLVEMELRGRQGEPVYPPFRFGVVLPAGDAPFEADVPLEITGNPAALERAGLALSRAKSVRVRDVRPWPGKVTKAALWIE